jgi:hypothetical protein
MSSEPAIGLQQGTKPAVLADFILPWADSIKTYYSLKLRWISTI